VSRVNIYFTTLSSVLVASAFLAQQPLLAQLLQLFAWIAFPVVISLGLFTFARLIILANMDFVYIRAINRLRHFYTQAVPEAQPYLLFPAHDDDRSVSAYGGYIPGFRANLLSAGGTVIVINCILTTTLLSTLISQQLGITPLSFLPYGVGLLVAVYLIHV